MYLFRYDLLSIAVFILIIVAVVLFPLIPIIKKAPFACVQAPCAGSTLYLTFRTLPQVVKNQQNTSVPMYRLFDINK